MDSKPAPEIVEATLLKKPRKPRVMKVSLSGKPAKYFMNRQKGMNKKDAAVAAGYTDNNNQSKIELSKTYQTIEKSYKNVLIEKVTMEQIADEHKKNIMQDQDKGAKNAAIKMALDKIEPEAPPGDDDDKVMVILRG